MTTTLKNFFNVLKKYYDIETPSIKSQTVGKQDQEECLFEVSGEKILIVIVKDDRGYIFAEEGSDYYVESEAFYDDLTDEKILRNFLFELKIDFYNFYKLLKKKKLTPSLKRLLVDKIISGLPQLSWEDE